MTRDGFNRDFLTAIGGESKGLLHQGQVLEVSPGKSMLVKPISAWDNGWVDAAKIGLTRGVGYASTTVICDTPGWYYLYLSSHGSPKLYVNGDLVIEEWQDTHAAKSWQHGLRLHLDAGKHRLLLKLDNQRGWWVSN